jgi:hypothetical protein
LNHLERGFVLAPQQKGIQKGIQAAMSKSVGVKKVSKSGPQR